MHRVILSLVLGLSPFLLGSNRQLFWATNGLLASLALITFALSLLRRPGIPAPIDRSLFGVGLIFLAVSVWMFVQASPLTPDAWHHPAWELAARLGGLGSISINPSYALSAIGFWISLAVMLIGVWESANARFVTLALKLSASVALAVAGFGITTMILGIPTLGLAEKTSHLKQLTGTFANPNNAATFFCFGMISALVLAGGGPSAQAASNVRARAVVVWLAITITLFAAVILTGSRGGLISAVAGLVTFFAVWSRQEGRYRARRFMQGAIVVAVILAAAGTAKVGLFDRTDTEASTQVRLSLYQEAIEAIKDRPLIGHGAGAYRDIQPRYHRPETPTDLVWNRAHSTYLESAAALGLPVAVFVCAALILILVRMTRSVIAAGPSPALLAALPMSAVAGVHSAVDFSLQIQSIALYYALFLGIGLGATTFNGASGGTGLDRGSAAGNNRRSGEAVARRPIPTVALVSTLAFIGVVASIRIGLIELSVSPSLWLSELRPFRILIDDKAFTRTMREHALTWVDDAYLFYSREPECRLVELSRPPPPSYPHDFRVRCLSLIDAALREAPATPGLWLSRAEVLVQVTSSLEEFHTALRNSYLTGSREGYLSTARLSLALPLWQDLPLDLRDMVAEELRLSTEDTLAELAGLYLAGALDRESIRIAMEALAGDKVRGAFAEAVRRQSDSERRRADLLRSLQRANDCALDCSSVVDIEIIATAETDDEPAILRIWLDGRLVHEAFVTAAISGDDAAHSVSTPETASGQVSRASVPQNGAAETIEIEFVNDAWAPEEEMDRNVAVTRFTLDGTVIPLTWLSPPLGSERSVLISEDAIRFYRNGTVRYQVNSAN